MPLVLRRAFLGAAAFTLLALAVVGWDWAKTRNRPAEHTVVVSVQPAGGDRPCGRHYGRAEVVTRVSSDPPPGMAATFSDVEACDVPSVGDRETLVRVARGQQDPKVYVDPARSLAGVVGLSLAVGGLVFAVAFVLYGAVALWGWWRARLLAHRQAA